MRFRLFDKSGGHPAPSSSDLTAARSKQVLVREYWFGLRVVDDIANDHSCGLWWDDQERATMLRTATLAPPRSLS